MGFITSIPGILVAIGATFFTILIIRTYLTTKIKATLYLFLLSFCIALNGVFFAIFMSVPETYESIAFIFIILAIISALIAVLSTYIFFEYLEYGYIRTYPLFLYGLFLGAFICGLFFPEQTILTYSPTFASWLFYITDFLRVIGIGIGLLTIYRLIGTYISIYKAVQNPTLRSQFLKIGFGFIFGLIGIAISVASGVFIINYNPTLGNTLRGLYPIFIFIGIAITVIGTLSNPYSLYLISQKIYQIIIFNMQGVLLFNREFFPNTAKQASLITGALYGVSSMIQHALGIESLPKSISFEDRILLFEFRNNIAFALISDRDSVILRNGLHNFADLFIQTYGELLPEWDGSIKSFVKTNDFLKISFPFIDLVE